MCSTWPRPSPPVKFRWTRSTTRGTTQAITESLTAVKGIGVWTAEMFLIFALNRPDILPAGDLGVRVGLRRTAWAGPVADSPRVSRPGRTLAAVPHDRQLVHLEGRRYAERLGTWPHLPDSSNRTSSVLERVERP